MVICYLYICSTEISISISLGFTFEGLGSLFLRLVKNSDFVGIGVDSLSIELGRTQVRFGTKENDGFS